MQYFGMPMAMWMLYHKSFQRQLVAVLNFDRRTAETIIRNAKPKYREIIAKIPPFEKEDRFQMNLVNAAMFASIYLAMNPKPTVEPLAEYYRASMMTVATRLFCKLSGRRKFTDSDVAGMKKTAAFRAADRNPYSWNMEFLPYTDDSGYKARFTKCGICTLMKELDIFEVTPAMCRLDYAMSEAGGASDFVREYTLASGGAYCDCGYRKKAKKHGEGSLKHSAQKPLYPKDAARKCKAFLRQEYGIKREAELWDKTLLKYTEFVADAPDIGGAKNTHAAGIYGTYLMTALFETAFCDRDATDPALQNLAYNVFMKDSFGRLGKIFNLNRPHDMFLANLIFKSVARKDEKIVKEYPASFRMHCAPFDKEHQAVRYHFSLCPNAEFAKAHNLTKWMPLFCNCDYLGMQAIHGTLIRTTTCVKGDKCDYLIVGDKNPLADMHPRKTDADGLWVNE